MARRLDEKEAAMDACVLDVPFSLSCEFLAEVGRMLILNVFDNRVPAVNGVSFSICELLLRSCNGIPSIVIHLITITRGVDNIQPKANTILLND